MQFTHKFKPKIVKQLTAVLLVAVTALSFLSITASAGGSQIMFTNTEGGKSTVYSGDWDYGIADHWLAWKIDMYVSTRENGKVDPATDRIDSKELPWVGGVLYESLWTGGGANAVYVQTDYTNDIRSKPLIAGASPIYRNGPYIVGYEYSFPQLSALRPNMKSYNVSGFGDRKQVTHINGNPLELPVYTTKYYNYKTDVAPILESAEGVTQVLKDINTGLGGSVDDLGPLYEKVITLIGSGPKAKLVASKEATGTTDYNLLLPTNENPIVQWVMVAVPMMGWNENRVASSGKKDSTFWEYTTASNIGVIGADCNSTVMLLDAYDTAKFNQTSKAFYADKSVLSQLEKLVNIDDNKDGDGDVISQFGSKYRKKGKLVAIAPNATVDLAHVAYGVESMDPFCGVPMAGRELDAFNHLMEDSADYAKYGGLSVYISKIGEPGIPVYYYEYDSSDKPTGKVYTEDYKPNGKTTFTPSDKYGIPIADESNNATDKQYTNSMGIPYYADWWNTRDPITWDYDYRESYSTYGTIIDAQPKAYKADAANPVSIKNEELNIVSSNKKGNAKSIHVKVVEEPSTKVYYHTLTLTADLPDDAPTGTTAEQLFSSDPDLFEGSWTQTSRKISPSPKYTPVQNVNTLRAAQKPVDKSAQPWYNERKEVSLWDMFHR